MGSTGTGKSSLIQLITRDESIDIGESLESETFEVKDFRFVDHTGRNIRLVDTPGFDDSRPGFTDTDILKGIVNFLLKEYDEKRKLNGLIYLQRISDPRFGGQSMRNLRMFKELCGTDSYRNVVVLTTFWDEVNETKGATREAQLKSKFFKALVDGGARFMRHDRTIESARAVLEHVHTLVPTNVGIVNEIRVEGKTLEDTAAGSVRREEVERIITKHKEEVAELQAQMSAAQKSNLQAIQGLQDERAEMQKQLARFERE
ncbi:P-loop containing nucleoside triphosphate hydrolase protein, partial [Mycena galopus ATCC 62051]